MSAAEAKLVAASTELADALDSFAGCFGLERNNVAYVSTPITTGKRHYDWLQDYRPDIGSDFERDHTREVIAVNQASARALIKMGREITKRTAAFSIAIAGFALIDSACSHTNNASGTSSSATSSATSSSATSSAAATTTPAGPSTQMTGANGAVYVVQGPILDKYNSLNEKARKDLGAPRHAQVTNLDGGIFQTFDGGMILYKTAAYVVWGKIRDAWIALGASQGKLGYPTSDEFDTPDGQKKSTFEHGTLTWKPGEARATVSYS